MSDSLRDPLEPRQRQERSLWESTSQAFAPQDTKAGSSTSTSFGARHTFSAGGQQYAADPRGYGANGQQDRAGQSYAMGAHSLGASVNGYGISSPAASNATALPKRTGPGWFAAIALAAVAAMLGGLIGISGNQALRPSNYSAATSKSSSVQAAPVVESKGEAPNWQAVQEAVGDSVVAIATDFGQGSGVIIDQAGHVLTNEHVISGAKEMYATLADGRMYKATLSGADEATDLAVLQIQDAPDDLTAATLGDSSSLHVGQDVAAIGNPLGLSSTMTTGIISALNRPVTTQKQSTEPRRDDFFPFGKSQPAQPDPVVTNAIQLDAAINPGNSGGPLFDSAGRVIGITSSIASLSGGGSEAGSIGIGFAIPINLAKNVSQQLMENGVAEHAFLGVTISQGAANFDGVTRLGAEVQSVSSGTPAEKAGIVQGDVIIAIDGNEVTDSASLTGFVRQYRSGDQVTVTLERDGKLQDTDVKLTAKRD